MVYPKPAISLAATLVILSLVESFKPFCDWFLTKYTDGEISSFPNVQNEGLPSLSSDKESDFSSAVSCGSLRMNQVSWNLEADFDDLVSSNKKFAIGFWVNFESTIGSEFFIFGTSPKSVRVSSYKEGTLTFKTYSSTGSTDSDRNWSVTVHMRNFHIGRWFFWVLFLADAGGALAEVVLIPGNGVQQNVVWGGPYGIPKGDLKFGKDIKANFYEVVVAMSHSNYGNSEKIYLSDGSDQLNFSDHCFEQCPDFHCTPKGKCLAKNQLCAACSGEKCTSCSITNGDSSTYCNSCIAGWWLGRSDLDGNWKCILICDVANNCYSCSISSTICDSCPINYFFYKASPTSTSCISCDNSCKNCSPGPNCYQCADSIFQSGNTCRVDKIGYRISFDYPNIVLDLAYPLSSEFTKNSFFATTIGGTPIPTTSWTFTGCAAGSIQCIIETNLKEIDLPISIDLQFDQA